jgi:mannose-6-phosphate isomerase-like protein (cupin superfamily)
VKPFDLRRTAELQAFRISPNDTNYFAVLFAPEAGGYPNICVVEIFAVNGRTPPNSHREAYEMFYVLSGEGAAICDGERTVIARGDALLLRPGSEHIIENTGASKLYTLTTMSPNEEFAELILAGQPVDLDAEDLAVLAGAQGAQR